MATPTSNPGDASLHTTVHETEAIPALAGPEVESSPANPKRLRELYQHLLKCSLVRRRVSKLRAEGRIERVTEHPFSSVATGVGALIELRAGDAVAADDTILTPLLIGESLESVMSSVYGFPSDFRSSQRGMDPTGPHHLPVMQGSTTQFHVAGGVALAAKLQSCRSAVLTHSVDAFAALGHWHEAAIFAVCERLPLVFVFETNSPLASNLDDATFRDRAESYGMPGITVEGTDVVAVWRVAQESIHRARSGAGPTMIDCRVGYSARRNGKPPLEGEDELAHMEHYLQQRNFWDAEWREEIVQAYSAEIENAVEYAEKIRRAQ